MTTADKATIQRLAFIKYLYALGVKQSNSAEPMRAASLLTMHDAVELFLQLASEYCDAGKKDIDFMSYWDILSHKLTGDGLSQKESMRRFNRARVALKHHGTMPSRLDVEAFRGSVTNFFEENTPRVFGVQFSTVSLLDLVACESAHNELREAQRKIEENNVKDALSHCCLAFYYLLDDYEARSRISSLPFSPYTINVRSHAGDIPELQNFVDDIKRLIEYVENAVKILTLGIDGRKYTRFKVITPTTTKMLDGHYELNWGRRHTQMPLTKDDADFCLNFVIETALILQQVDL